MSNLNYKTKTILIIVGFILFAVGMVWFGFGIIGNKNQATADEIAKKRIELGLLEKEQKSLEQGKKDLAQLASSTYPPENLFSKDTRVVNEIQRLEEASKQAGVELNISVTGTQKTAEKVKGVSSDLITIPYTITLNGSFANELTFMQYMEHMPFITHADDITIIVSSADKTKMLIRSKFFIKP